MVNGFKSIYIDNLYGLGFILSQLFFAIGLNYILNPWSFKTKKEILYKVIELFVSLLVMFGISCLFASFYTLPYYKAFFTIIDIIMFIFSSLLVAYNVIFLKKDFVKEATIAMLFYCLFEAQSNISGWLGTCQEYVWHILEGKIELTLVGNVLGMFLIFLLMLKMDFKKFIFVPKTMLWLTSGYFLFNMVNFGIFRLFFLQPVKEANFPESFFIVYGSFILLSVLVYAMIYYNAKEYNAKTLEQLVIENNKGYIEMMRMSEDKYNAVRKINHDIKNQFMMLQMLSKEKKYDDLEKYLDSYLSTMGNNIVYLSNSGNKIIDDVVNIAFTKCDKSGVKLNTRIIVPPELNIVSIDFCSLVTNLIDNAINALEEVDKKEINLEIEYINSSLLLSMSNPTNKKYTKKELKNLLYSTNQTNYHGWGLKIVQTVVDKYKGSINLECENSIFGVNIVLFLEAKKNGTNL